MPAPNPAYLDETLAEIQQLLHRHSVLTTMARRQEGAPTDRRDLLAFNEAELVFVGDVTAIERQDGPADAALMNVRFRIIERFKGGAGVLGQPRGPVVVGDVRRLDGTPADKVRIVVRLGSSIVASSVTDATGHYQIPWLTPGRYTVAVDGSSRRGGTGRQIIVTGETRCLVAPTIQIQ